MPIIALALALASSVHAAVAPPANQQHHLDTYALVGNNKPASTTKNILGKADGIVSINVEVDMGDDEDLDLNALLSQVGQAKGDMKIVIVGPDGKKRVIERELTGIDMLLNQVDVSNLLDRIDLNALMQQTHGNHDHGHGKQSHDALQGIHGLLKGEHHGEVHIEMMMENGDRSVRGMGGDDMEHPFVGQWHTRSPRRGDGRGMLFHSDNGDEAWFVVADIDGDMGMHQQHGRPEVEHFDMDMHQHRMDRQHHGDEHDMDMHRQMMDRQHHGDEHDMDMHRQMMGDGGHNDDPDAFFRASASFIEQLEHAQAVAERLNNGEATALLAIWYASEHMEPNQCLELMASIMNDESVLPTVRRAAAFTAVRIAGEMGNDQLAGRILGALVRGAGMTDEARRHRTQASETDRAPHGQRDRASTTPSQDGS